jgi:hypothetical protein
VKLVALAAVMALAVAACNVKPNDYDGDKKADIVYIAGGPSGGAWVQDGVATPLWAGMRSIDVGGDYDNDGKWEPAELVGRDWFSSKLAAPIHYDPPGLPSATPDWPTGSGGAGAAVLPVPADYDGDGDTDPAYYALVDGTWWINGRAGSTQFGTPPIHSGHLDWDVPVPGDYDGDLKADLAVFHPTDHTFHILQSKTSTERVVAFPAMAALMPVPADYDGDGRTDPAVANTLGTTWWLTPDTTTPTFTFPSSPSFAGGHPVVADYDGDSKADPAAYDAGTGIVQARIGGVATTLTTLPSNPVVLPALPYAERVNIIRLTFYGRCLSGVSSGGATLPLANWQQCPSHPTASDYTGDHRADPVYLQGLSSTWSQLGVSGPLFSGQSTDFPAPGDYDGDGRWEPAVVRGTSWVSSRLAQPIVYAPAMPTGPAPKAWYWKLFNHSEFVTVPVPGDYDGDHRTDPAYYDYVDGTWWISGRPSPVQFGIPPVDDGSMAYDVPVPADYDGDGKTDLAIYRPSDSTFHVRPSTGVSESTMAVGSPGDIPVPADYNGDNKADPATYRLSSQQWFIGTNPPVVVPGADAAHLQDPAPADYDGDGKAKPAVVDETTGAWRVLGTGLIGSTGLSSSTSFNLVIPTATGTAIPRLFTVSQCRSNPTWQTSYPTHCPSAP